MKRQVLGPRKQRSRPTCNAVLFGQHQRPGDRAMPLYRDDRQVGEGVGLNNGVGKWLHLLMRNKMLMLMLGGAIGTYARYWLSKWFGAQPWAQGFPYGTFVINVSGSFILAVAAVIILERLPPEHQDWYLLIGTGLCGGYPTFSTSGGATFGLGREGRWGCAPVNLWGRAVAGVLARLAASLFVGLA